MEFTDIYAKLETGERSIGVVGLGYVGLPLAVELSRHFDVVGFDISEKRVGELKAGIDVTDEAKPLQDNLRIEYTTDPARLESCPLVIVATPTPITADKVPDFRPLESAMRLVGRNLHAPTVLVIESTVYPGATERLAREIFIQELALKQGEHFKLGYSPERVNPGDKTHTLTTVTKIISGEDAETLSLLEKVYGKVTNVYPTSSIATAEAAKVIENIQRDLNISLANELAVIFDRLGVDTNEVIDAAATKWNFVPFRPGLVGGHCIGVDPYYLTHRAEELGYTSEVILAGRRMNDGIGRFITEKTVKLLIESGRKVGGSKVALFGITFKENIRDIRNSRVIDLVKELRGYDIDVVLTDPFADPDEVKREYGITLVGEEDIKGMDGLILAVSHAQFLNRNDVDFLRLADSSSKPVFVDVKAAYSASSLPSFIYWRL